MTDSGNESEITRWRPPVGYEVIAELHRDGVASFWEARQRSTDRRVLLKVILPPHATDRNLALCHLEAAVAREVDDPGILQVLDVGTSEACHYVAYEFLEDSRSLAEVVDELRKAPRLPPHYDAWCADLVAEVADTMAAVHGAGVLHRGLSGRSILLTSSGESKVTSFELAQIESDRPGTDEIADEDETWAGEIVGVPRTMSPEQARGFRVDQRSDVYSLGAVLFFLLTLRYPLQGKTSRETLFLLLSQGGPADPREVRPNTPPELAAVCKKALSRDPNDRYQSMTEFAEALRACFG